MTNVFLVAVANPPRAWTREFLSHVWWHVSSLLIIALNLQYWEKDRTTTPTSSLSFSSPGNIYIIFVSQRHIVFNCQHISETKAVSLSVTYRVLFWFCQYQIDLDQDQGPSQSCDQLLMVKVDDSPWLTPPWCLCPMSGYSLKLSLTSRADLVLATLTSPILPPTHPATLSWIN